jgi:hypothetical protein
MPIGILSPVLNLNGPAYCRIPAGSTCHKIDRIFRFIPNGAPRRSASSFGKEEKRSHFALASESYRVLAVLFVMRRVDTHGDAVEFLARQTA